MECYYKNCRHFQGGGTILLCMVSFIFYFFLCVCFVVVPCLLIDLTLFR